jgi:uncharacterized protein YcsI (UPF0317 family)
MNINYPATPQALEEAAQARLRIRKGYDKPTAGMAPGMTQVNMIALPRDWAFDFLLYAQRNPKVARCLMSSKPGNATLCWQLEAVWIRTYRVTGYGVMVNWLKK